MENKKRVKVKSFFKIVAVFIVFFIGTCSIMAIDTICKETTGQGGKLVFDVEKAWVFN